MSPLSTALRGAHIFCVSAANNNNDLQTNINCKIVQDNKYSTHDMIALQTTKKVAYNEKTPRKNSQKRAEIEFGYFHPYIVELVKIYSKIRFLVNITRQRQLGLWIYF